jgi:hypothetical protein
VGSVAVARARVALEALVDLPPASDLLRASIPRSRSRSWACRRSRTCCASGSIARTTSTSTSRPT